MKLADLVVPGGIDAYLLSLRAEGLSFETIARRLHADHGIETTQRTVKRWVDAAKAGASTSPEAVA